MNKTKIINLVAGASENVTLNVTNTTSGVFNVTVTVTSDTDPINATDTTGNITTIVKDITPPMVTNASANPISIPVDTDNDPRWGETSQLNVTVTDPSGIDRVTINLSAIGGSATQPMTNIGENIWTVTTNASNGTPPMTYNLEVNATDLYGNSNTSLNITLNVVKNGDVNEDGNVTIYDAYVLARYVLDIPGPEINKGASEVSGNGEISLFDAMYLAKHVLGKVGYEILH